MGSFLDCLCPGLPWHQVLLRIPSPEQPAEQEKGQVSSCLSPSVCSVCLGCPSTCGLVSGLEVVEGAGWLGSGLPLPQVCASDQEG